MARPDGYQAEVAEINAVLPQILENCAPRLPNSTEYIQYLLMINGRVPYGERTRRSPAACRSALRRLIRRGLYDQIFYPRQRRGQGLDWAAQKRYNLGGVDRVIKQLEEQGVVEYRATDFGTRTAVGLTS